MAVLFCRVFYAVVVSVVPGDCPDFVSMILTGSCVYGLLTDAVDSLSVDMSTAPAYGSGVIES